MRRPKPLPVLSLCLLLLPSQYMWGQARPPKPAATTTKPVATQGPNVTTTTVTTGATGAGDKSGGNAAGVFVGTYSLTEQPFESISMSGPDYVLLAGQRYVIDATADSTAPVSLIVKTGNATITKIAGGSFAVRPIQTGSLVVEAALQCSAKVTGKCDALATPVDMSFVVATDANEANSLSVCSVLLPTTSSSAPALDATTLISLAGDTSPFQLKAVGKNTIFIYQSKTKSSSTLTAASVKAKLLLLQQDAPPDTMPSSPFSIEIPIRHPGALGDLTTRLGSINPSKFTITDVGANAIRVTSPSKPDCDTWRAFLKDVRREVFGISPEPANTRLFYLSAGDVSTAFGTTAASAKSGGGAADNGGGPGTNGSAPSSGAGSAASGTGKGTGGKEGSTNGAGVGTTPPTSADAADGNTSTKGTGNTSGNSTTTVTIGGATTTLTATNSGSTPGGTSDGGSTSPSGANPASPSQASGLTGAPTNKQALTIAPLESDILLFSDANAGDDSAVGEKKRILAQLDLPRPEMIINAWVMQNSTGDPRTAGQFTSLVRELVNQHNDKLQQTILQGYIYLKNLIATPHNYFEPTFYTYLTQRYIARNPYEVDSSSSLGFRAEQYLAGHAGAPSAAVNGAPFGICPIGSYCLGYSTLFQPLKPRLTDLLLGIVASTDPAGVATRAIDAAEKEDPKVPNRCPSAKSPDKAYCREMLTLTDLTNFEADLRTAASGIATQNGPKSCDRQDIFREIRRGGDSYSSEAAPNLQLECFREQTTLLLTSNASGDQQPYGPGLLRAAIANFLFNYKMSQQYPHEFTAYDLSLSADALNTALSPLIDAFNRDIAAYQVYLRAVLENEVTRINNNAGRSVFAKTFGIDKAGFTNNGLVTVRTISGQEAQVNTVSQSYLDAGTVPEVSQLASDVLNGLTGSSSSGSSSGGKSQTGKSAASEVSNVFTPQAERLAQASLAALKDYQSSQAQIGRAIKLDVIPRSLAGASAAEINVSFNVDDSANPTYYSSGPSNGKAVNLSRVATHDTSTHIRVDSVRLFEISSITAVLQRPRPRLPLLPPLVELPYIGTFAGVPLPAAKEYHNSTAVLSAIVVPTAADLAYGLQFVSDRIIDPDLDLQSCRWPWEQNSNLPLCRVRKAESLRDLNDLPIREFNRVKVHCIATGDAQGYSTLDQSSSPCKGLTLYNVLTDAY
jgi:hypothetical protein